MTFTVPSFLIYVASWLAAVSAVWTIFEKLETVLTEDAKKKISRALRYGSLALDERWVVTALRASDRLFGDRLLSWRSFRWSCVMSLSVIAVLLLLVASGVPVKVQPWVPGRERGFLDVVTSVGATALTLAVLTNLVPDYLALIQTRSLLRVASRRNSTRLTLALLVVAMVTSLLIGTVSVALVTYLVTGFNLEWTFFFMFLSFVPEAWADGPGTGGLLILSTTATSLWYLAFVAATALTRLSLKADRAAKFAVQHLDVAGKPVRCVSLMAIFAITMVYLVAPLFSFF